MGTELGNGEELGLLVGLAVGGLVEGAAVLGFTVGDVEFVGCCEGRAVYDGKKLGGLVSIGELLGRSEGELVLTGALVGAAFNGTAGEVVRFDDGEEVSIDGRDEGRWLGEVVIVVVAGMVGAVVVGALDDGRAEGEKEGRNVGMFDHQRVGAVIKYDPTFPCQSE